MPCCLRIHNVKVVLLATLSGIVGCGSSASDAPSTLVEVTGQVTQGGQPVAYASLIFTPLTEAAPSTAMTDENGNYSMIYNDGRPGAVPGTHDVSITVGEMPTATADGDDVEVPPPLEPKLYLVKSDVGNEPTKLDFNLDSL